MPFPYTFPITFEVGYFIEIDWDNNGNFTGADDDITADIRSVHFSRGKSSELDKAEVGQFQIAINNATGKYTPPNAAGDLYGNLLPRRPVKFYYSTGGTDYPLFYGYIEEIIPHPHPSEQDCIITAVDGLDYLSRHDLATSLYKNTLPGTIHSYILNDASWSATLRTLDTGQNTMPYWYGADVKSRFAQEEIDDSEQGFSYVNGSGYFCFEDRQHRSSATHQTATATFTNTMAQMAYSLNAKNIYNIIKVTVTPWTVQAIAELWRLEEVPEIPAGTTLTWWGNSDYFVDAWTTPEATTDYTANSLATGLGDNETANISITTTKFGKAIKLVVTNNAAHPVFITLLKARGTWYDSETKTVRKTEDTTSQTAYQKRTLELDGKYMSNANTAQDYADYAIGKYKDPRAELSMTLINKDATMLTQILSREISDRVNVVNTELGISGGYFIDYMEHDISMAGLKHTVTYRLAAASNEDFWCMDYSAFPDALGVGTQTKLGY